jgi:hypothetical protein
MISCGAIRSKSTKKHRDFSQWRARIKSVSVHACTQSCAPRPGEVVVTESTLHAHNQIKINSPWLIGAGPRAFMWEYNFACAHALLLRSSHTATYLSRAPGLLSIRRNEQSIDAKFRRVLRPALDRSVAAAGTYTGSTTGKRGSSIDRTENNGGSYLISSHLAGRRTNLTTKPAM